MGSVHMCLAQKTFSFYLNKIVVSSPYKEAFATLPQTSLSCPCCLCPVCPLPLQLCFNVSSPAVSGSCPLPVSPRVPGQSLTGAIRCWLLIDGIYLGPVPPHDLGYIQVNKTYTWSFRSLPTVTGMGQSNQQKLRNVVKNETQKLLVGTTHGLWEYFGGIKAFHKI